MGYYLLSFLMIFSLSGALYAAEAGGKIGMKSGKSEKASSEPKGKAPSVQSKGEGQNKGGGKHGGGRHRHHKKSPYFPNLSERLFLLRFRASSRIRHHARHDAFPGK